MIKPKVISMDELFNSDLNNSAVWTVARFSSLVREHFSIPVFTYPKEPRADFNSLIVIGGGVMIDFAKIWRKNINPKMKLIAIPSIWGSGAENSPIAVFNSAGGKVIMTGKEFLPDIRIVWDKLAESLPPHLIKYACGDVYAHALEGFLSPLANNKLRTELSELIRKLLATTIENTLTWFELSAAACAAQARSSVGLIHGIAHNAEGQLKQKYPNKYFGHAQLCATCLWPVMSFNLSVGDKAQRLFSNHAISSEKVTGISKRFFDNGVFDDILTVIAENWMSVVRDPSSRTNCVLVRSNHLSYFTEKSFQ